jgi:hypothetical protein
MAEEKRHTDFTAADIEKYWKGQLPAAAMHAMEKAALDDPFLADAMDGYRVATTATSFEKQTETLQEHLQQRINSAKVVPLTKKSIPNWFKIAALFVITLGAFAAYRILNNNIAENNEAKNTVVVPSAKPKENKIAPAKNNSFASEVPTNNQSSISADSTTYARIDKAIPTNKKRNFVEPGFTDSATAVNDVAKLSNNNEPEVGNLPIPQYKKTDNNSVSRDTLMETNTAPPPAPVATAEKNDKTSIQKILNGRAAGVDITKGELNKTQRTVTGQVVDENNEPLKGALVRFPELNKTTLTNKKGQFTIAATDSLITASISHNGFYTQNRSLLNSSDEMIVTGMKARNQQTERLNNTALQQNRIQLREQSNAVNTVEQDDNYKKLKDEEENEDKTTNELKQQPKNYDVTVLNAAPLIGWNDYNTYLEKKRVLIKEVKNIHGSVIVALTVTKNGLRNIYIQKSLNDYLDAEALRLVKEGPAWKLLKGKKAFATVMVKF